MKGRDNITSEAALLTAHWQRSFWSRVSFPPQRPCYLVCSSKRMRLCTKDFGFQHVLVEVFVWSLFQSWQVRSYRFQHHSKCVWCPFAHRMEHESGQCTSGRCQRSCAGLAPISRKRGSTGKPWSRPPPNSHHVQAPGTPSGLQDSTSSSIGLVCSKHLSKGSAPYHLVIAAE